MKFSRLVLICMLASIDLALQAQPESTEPQEGILIDSVRLRVVIKEIESVNKEIQFLELQLKKIELELQILEEKTPGSKLILKNEEELYQTPVPTFISSNTL